MGNNKIASLKGSIEIKTQRTFYYSNETIQGWVILNVHQNGFKAGIVHDKKFVGRDIASHMFQSDLDGGVLSQLDKIFINSFVYLDNFGEQLPIIAIVYPFEIVLNLYASSIEQGFEDEKTQIEFYLVSEIVNLNNKLDTEIKFKLPIQIHQALSHIPKPICNIYRDDQYCCCLTKEKYPIITVNLAKNEYQLEEIIKIDVEIDQSSCTQDLQLTICLYRKLEVQFPEEFVDSVKIYSQELLKFERGQKSMISLQLKINCEKFCSTVYSPNIQVQYILSFHIHPSGTVYKFPITIIKPETQLINQFIYNYDESLKSEGTILIKKKARLIVNQLDSMTAEQISWLTRYQKQQFNTNQQYDNYHAYNSNYQPNLNDIQYPIIVQQQQQILIKQISETYK